MGRKIENYLKLTYWKSVIFNLKFKLALKVRDVYYENS